MSAASIFKVQPPTGKPVFITGGKEVFDGYSVHKDVSSLSLSVRVSRLFEFVKKYFQSFFPPAQATDLEKLSALRERQWLLQTAYFGKEQLLILTHRTPKPDDQDLIGGLVPPPSNSLTSDVQAAALPVLTPVPAPKPMSRPNVPSSASSASTAQLPATPSSSQVAPTPFPRAKQRLNFDLPDATPASEHQPSVQKEASSASSASTAQLPASPSAVPVAQTVLVQALPKVLVGQPLFQEKNVPTLQARDDLTIISPLKNLATKSIAKHSLPGIKLLIGKNNRSLMPQPLSQLRSNKFQLLMEI